MKKLLIALLLVASVSWAETNSTVTGITIEQRPVIVITMETNHVYRLWMKDKLSDPWQIVPFMEHFTCTGTPKRVILEKGVNADTGFYKLEMDFSTNFLSYVEAHSITNIMPAMPGGAQ